MLDWFEFEEMVGRRWHRWASRASSYPHHPEAAVDLASVRDCLATCFRAHGGEPGLALDALQPQASGHRLSWRQRLGLDSEYLEMPRRDDEYVVLPAALDCFPDAELNRQAYFWLVAYLAYVPRLPQASDPLQADVLFLHAVKRTVAAIGRELPAMAQRYRRLGEALLDTRPVRSLPAREDDIERVIRALLGARRPQTGAAARLHEMLQDRDIQVDAISAPRGYRSFLPVPIWGSAVSRTSAPSGEREHDDAAGEAAPEDSQGARKRAERRNLDQTERDDPLLINIFEKVLSWTEMVNVNRHVEDDDPEEARQAAEQMDELALNDSDRETSTRLRMALDVDPEAVDEQPLRAELTYPEWHYRRGAYLPDHCTVIAGLAAEQGEAWQADAAARRRIARIRRQFEALRPRRERLRAQLDGSELDTDAVVRRRCDLAAGGDGSDRVYALTREQGRDLAVALLVDVSLSTEAWMEDRRVLDIEKEALLALVHGLDACGDDHAVYTFSSQRRQRVWVDAVKRFDERLGDTVERRIQALKPGRYTRMGAALRHVTAELAARGNQHRLLLVLTDGKPNDSDHYEGRFALEDTRRAVLEARSQGLAVFGATIDDQARDYFPYLFGPGGYAIVRNPAALPSALPGIYRHLVAG